MSVDSAPLMRKTFAAETAGKARAAACDWLRDFTAHGPLHIRHIRVVEHSGRLAAVVTYSEAEIEASPRYFETPEPLRRSA